MGFVQRELDRIEAALVDEAIGTERFQQLFAAQQALKWTTEPQGFATPLDSIDKLPASTTVGSRAEPAGCSA